MLFESLNNPHSQTVDVIITSVPYLDSEIPVMAPAALKSSIDRAGMTSKCVDLNAEVRNAVHKHPEKVKITDLLFRGIEHKEVIDWTDSVIQYMAIQILTWKPKYVGLSLFSINSRYAARKLCQNIRRLNSETKIIIGGPGCLEEFTGPTIFADEMLDKNLVDFYVRGDGEHALFELLKGNIGYPGINTPTNRSPEWRQIPNDELEKLPYPNYQDYNWNLYTKKLIGIQGSRGCVRSCTFCDYITNWTKFQWRSAENVFAELLHQRNLHELGRFKFHDALTNGNLIEFNKLMKMMGRFNRKHKHNPREQFRWTGFYIFREHSAKDDEMWRQIALSGAVYLVVGVESFNEDIRWHMGKKFSNASIDYHLAQAKKYGIRLLFLMIVGYVTETEKHVEFTKQWLKDHVEYKDIITFTWGNTLNILPNTYLSDNADQIGIVKGSEPMFWINPSTGSNPPQRLQWLKEISDLTESLGYENDVVKDVHRSLELALYNFEPPDINKLM